MATATLLLSWFGFALCEDGFLFRRMQQSSPSPQQRDAAADARFLIQATFGPTRTSLSDLQGKTYAGWIQEQINMTAGSHRTFYRQRANPALDYATRGAWALRSPCASGSRWHEFAFVTTDVGLPISVTSVGGVGNIFVNGVFRTNFKLSGWESTWTPYVNFNGYICFVRSRLSGDVHIASTSACTDKKYLQNPRVWLANGAPTKPMNFKKLRAGVQILEGDLFPCDFSDVSGQTPQFVRSPAGTLLWHSTRALLSDKNLGSRQLDACLPRNYLNEKTCLVAKYGTPQSTQGLKVEVRDTSSTVPLYISNYPVASFVSEFVVPRLNYPSTADFVGYPASTFTARYTANLTVTQVGSYQFWLKSDDGSRLTLDGVLLINNDGIHSVAEKTATVALTAGVHSFVLEYYNVWTTKVLTLEWSGPSTGNVRRVVEDSAFSVAIQTRSECYESCGSPGEVASVPALGHHLIFEINNAKDKGFDNRYENSLSSSLSKSVIWFAQALKSNDQLRQRMAWALSQIFPVGSRSLALEDYSEMFAAFHDIFVRNALGNFRDILKEMVFSPIMGQYLTHTGSKSYASGLSYPNENLAREIMQLFTIGLKKLHANGTCMVDPLGNAVPTYSNDNIMDFARVLTGFREQSTRTANVEDDKSYKVDPLYIRTTDHDVYPKPDLDGNYLGDGHPLCSDVSSSNSAFLAKGAIFDFVGTTTPSEGVLVLSPGSQLFNALCQSSGAGGCSLQSVVELQQTLQCSGAECSASAVKYVQVGFAFYRVVGSPCVSLWVPQALQNLTSNPPASEDIPATGYCLTSSGQQPSGKIRLDYVSAAVDSPTRQADCLNQCKAAGATGCELTSSGCYAHSQPVVSAGASSSRKCWIFSWNRQAYVGLSYVALPPNSLCPAGTEIPTAAECAAAGQAMYGLPVAALSSGVWSTSLPGCYYSRVTPTVKWNMNKTGAVTSSQSICRMFVSVDSGAKLTMVDGGTKVRVQWVGNSIPASGLYLAASVQRQAFTYVPSKQELKARLFVGALTPPGGSCSSSGEIAVCGSGSIDQSTVFFADGLYYTNVESVVSLVGAPASFRNPPIFMRLAVTGTEREAYWEVESLVDHLFRHQNTPAFISQKLIQRLTTSNPSPVYVQAVADAFRTGVYDGTQYSGVYGDLASTVAAILLHPEARTCNQSVTLTAVGALREPLLKVVHFLRSTEYREENQELTVFQELQSLIGQFPFESPSVFNFYLPEFPLMQGQLPAPEPEPESEPEPRFSPELQIFRPAYFINYLNGMTATIRKGVSRDCEGPEDVGFGVALFNVQKNFYNPVCSPAATLTASGDAESTIEELNVLFTGGRLSPISKGLVRGAYDRASTGQEVQGALQTLMMTPEFNTLGNPLPADSQMTQAEAPAAPASAPYKAAIFLFLAGGADTFNLLVPAPTCALFQQYVDVRTDLALLPSEMIVVPAVGQACSSFGVHSSFAFVSQLYASGEAAFISNVGNLVQPTTKATYESGAAERCFGLFSHSDQQNGAQTLKCQDGVGTTGAGGRIADALASSPTHSYVTHSFSLAGSATWSQGLNTSRELVDDKLTGYYEYEAYDETFATISSQRYGNYYANAYAAGFGSAVMSVERFSKLLAATPLVSWTAAPSGDVQNQLNSVAKLIRARQSRNTERDFFFVSVSGWDMHDDMKASLAAKFSEVDTALQLFVGEMKNAGVWNSVVLMTSSEFGRTLQSNGGGSDHAWAGNHFIIGGGIRGGQVLNKFPTSLALGNSNDLGRGRLVPGYPWESVMEPLAEWMGVQQAQLASVFPNLARFNSATDIIPKSTLFNA